MRAVSYLIPGSLRAFSGFRLASCLPCCQSVKDAGRQVCTAIHSAWPMYEVYSLLKAQESITAPRLACGVDVAHCMI